MVTSRPAVSLFEGRTLMLVGASSPRKKMSHHGIIARQMIVRIWAQPCDWLNDFDPITGNDAA